MNPLDLPLSIVEVLQQNGIIHYKQLKDLDRTTLKQFGLSNDEIHTIIVQLQLNGMDLKKKYKKKSNL